METITYLQHDTPIGPLRVAASPSGIRAVYMTDQRHVSDTPPPSWTAAGSGAFAQERLLDRARRQLDDYFAGRRTDFDLPLDVAGTEFQRAVWRGLSAIGFGETISYGELARRIGHPKAVRAVGLANGRNPVSVVVPCHRVIGANGTMTGYGGGIERKRFLLAFEARVVGGGSGSGEQLSFG